MSIENCLLKTACEFLDTALDVRVTPSLVDKTLLLCSALYKRVCTLSTGTGLLYNKPIGSAFNFCLLIGCYVVGGSKALGEHPDVMGPNTILSREISVSSPCFSVQPHKQKWRKQGFPPLHHIQYLK